MHRLLCIAVIVAVAALAGCGKAEPPPADTTDDRATMPEPISTEDFESGEVENAVQEAEEPVEDQADEGDQGEGQ